MRCVWIARRPHRAPAPFIPPARVLSAGYAARAHCVPGRRRRRLIEDDLDRAIVEAMRVARRCGVGVGAGLRKYFRSAGRPM